MRSSTLRAWSFVHLWSSLVCTVFLLMLCITGLPLIFHDEIDSALNPDRWQPANPGGAYLELDSIVDIALGRRPGEVPIFLSFDIDRPVVNVTTGLQADIDAGQMHFASFDLTSGDLVPPAEVGAGVMHFLLDMHTDMFLGLPGMLFLGAMGILFIVATITGVVLYAPFMRKLDFGTVRLSKSARIRWLDYHNLLGIVTVAWVLVVGVTGVINTLEEPIIDTWWANDLAELIAEHNNAQARPDRIASLDRAVRQAVEAAPNMTLQFVAFPGSGFSTDAHYTIFLHGRTPLTKRLITPVLVNAATGEFVGLKHMPWYAQALSLSRPLHFGDYGGLPLKVVWALMNLFTIIVLLSGVYLWMARRRGKDSAESINRSGKWIDV
ncbi:PepSY domain-containing protein [Exilibacterium tricleocarpae]|uniref:PepSY domain-containing protein n=1 Tax=Exilibacterium tricleocarpae TaxID=2591008 RepID=A0A545TND1_9GAMM|nr:PepSY domain-containing protein [Exilibacterium tricleocarpae]TQV78729.1 PepSY domain-containing protein [Exilibacterium tricleocarpae]